MVLDPWTIDPSLVCASEDAHRACGSITPAKMAVLPELHALCGYHSLGWKRFDYAMFAISPFRHPRAWSVFRAQRITPVKARKMCANDQGRWRYLRVVSPLPLWLDERL